MATFTQSKCEVSREAVFGRFNVSASNFVQFGVSRRARSTFLTDFFAFPRLKFTFGGPESGSEKKSSKRRHQQRTDRSELDLEVARTHFEDSKTSV